MNKYKAKKIEFDGYTFASKKECKRYQLLKNMQDLGQISALELQKKFELIPAQREVGTITKTGRVKQGKVIERACFYIADFVYIKDGETIVEDVKGCKYSKAYDLFVIKRKLMLYKYGIKIIEV